VPHLFFEQRIMAISLTRNTGRPSGFTLVELVVVIVIVGVMALVAIPRFIGVDSFKSRGFSDEAIGVVRYAQKTAIAWRDTTITTIHVCVTATGVSAGTAAGCATPLKHPTTGGALAASAPSGVTLSPVGNFTFDGLGRPSAAQTITLTSTIAGDPARQIVVEAETGYVHR
jgi:MSHA pilin protein MshC